MGYGITRNAGRAKSFVTIRNNHGSALPLAFFGVGCRIAVAREILSPECKGGCCGKRNTDPSGDR